MKIGAANEILTTVANGKFLNAIKIAKRATANRKRKRQTEMSVTKMNHMDILEIVKKDNLYKDISEDTSFAMRKWFTILLRRGLVNIHQRPKNDQASRKFKDAVKFFEPEIKSTYISM